MIELYVFSRQVSHNKGVCRLKLELRIVIDTHKHFLYERQAFPYTNDKHFLYERQTFPTRTTNIHSTGQTVNRSSVVGTFSLEHATKCI